jgi:hypothetical protein
MTIQAQNNKHTHLATRFSEAYKPSLHMLAIKLIT